MCIDNPDHVVERLEATILGHLNYCMPQRVVSMSSRDPSWMSPLVKSLLKKKAKVSINNNQRLEHINNRISQIISDNKKHLLVTPTGSCKWCKEVNFRTQRLSTPSVTLKNERLEQLNDYFGSLCTDDSYIEPLPVTVDHSMQIPDVSEKQVWQVLRGLKRTAVGPDNIPYWIWKDLADVFTPVICKLWNLCFITQSWPKSWKRANINPLNKVDLPTENNDYRGINITPVIARAFEKVIYKYHVKDIMEANLSPSQHAYRDGGNSTNALLAIQHTVYNYLDQPGCRAVRLFAMDFSKAFDSVKHHLLAEKLKILPLNPYMINLYLDFLKHRQQRVVYNKFIGNWKEINKGTIQGSVSGPYLFNIFLNDLEIEIGLIPVLHKYADDSTIIAPVWENKDCSSELVTQFFDWSNNNCMTCNPSKRKELIFIKRGTVQNFVEVAGIPQADKLVLLGVTFQSNTRFSIHVKDKLIKANKSLYVLRKLREDGYKQPEIDYMFNSIVMPNIRYGLSVYGAADAELTTVQCFLDRCKKRRYTSQEINIREIMKDQDRKIYLKVKGMETHPLFRMLPKKKETKYQLRNMSTCKPKIKTERFMNCFANRLNFRLNLVD